MSKAQRIALLVADGWQQLIEGDDSMYYKDDLVTNGENIQVRESEVEG